MEKRGGESGVWGAGCDGEEGVQGGLEVVEMGEEEGGGARTCVRHGLCELPERWVWALCGGARGLAACCCGEWKKWSERYVAGY